MIEFTNTIIIQKSIDDVFAFVSNLTNLPKWNYYVLEVRKLTDDSIGKGTKYHQIRKTDQQEILIKEYIKNQTLVIEAEPPPRKLIMELTFQEINGDTKIIDTWHLEGELKGPIKWLARAKAKTAVQQNLTKLKNLLETGSVTLQDGRTATIGGQAWQTQ
jgi:hypothetical protein